MTTLLLSGSRLSPLAKVTCFPDTAATTSNVPVDISVLGNDVDGDQLIDESTVRITVAPNNGTATPLASGEITYKSTADFVGTATFKYTVKDVAGVDALAEATVTVTVDAPAAFDAYSLDSSVDSPYTDRWSTWIGTGASITSITGGVKVTAGVAGGGDDVAVQMWNKTLFTPDDGTTVKFRLKRKDTGLGSAPVFPAMLFYWATKGNGTSKPVDPSSWTGVTAATRWENDCFGLRFSIDPRDGTPGITGNDSQVRTRKQDDGVTAGGLGEQILGTGSPNTSPGEFILVQDTAYDVTMTCVGGSFDIDVTPAEASVASPFVDLDWKSKLKAFSAGQTVTKVVSLEPDGQTKCVTTAANTTFDLRDKTFRVAHIDNVNRSAKSVIRVGSTASAASDAHAGTIITGAKVIGCGTGPHVIVGSYIWGKITWGMIKIGRKNSSPDSGNFNCGTKSWGESGVDGTGHAWDDDGIRFQLGADNCAIECCALYIPMDGFQPAAPTAHTKTLAIRSCYVIHGIDDFEVDVNACNTSWDDCFFEGLHTFISNADSGVSVDVGLNHSIVVLERQPFDYGGSFVAGGPTNSAVDESRYKGPYPNNTLETTDNVLAWCAGKPFKGDSGITVTAVDTLFVVHGVANSGTDTMDFPPGTYTRCALVWLGRGGGTYPGNARGMKVYDDTQAAGQKAADGLALYNAARDQWIDAHDGTVDANGYLDFPFLHVPALMAASEEAPVVSPRAVSLAGFNHPDTRYSAPVQGYLGIRAMETCSFEITNYEVSAATDPGVSTGFADEVLAAQTTPTITNCATAAELQTYLTAHVTDAAKRIYSVPGNHRVVLTGNIVYDLAGDITLKGAATNGPTTAKPWILCCNGDANRLKPRIGFKISMAGPSLTVWGLKFVPNANPITRTGRILLPGGNNNCKIQRCEFTKWLPDNLGAVLGTNGHAIGLNGAGTNTLIERCYLHDPGPWSAVEAGWTLPRDKDKTSLRIFLRQAGSWDKFQSNVTIRKCMFASTIIRPKPGTYNSGQADLLEDGGNGPSYRATTVAAWSIEDCRFDATGQGGPPIGFPGYPGTDLGGNADTFAEGVVDLKISGTTVLRCTFMNFKNRAAGSDAKDVDFRFGERGIIKQCYFENAELGAHGGKHLIVSNKFGTNAAMKLFTGDAAWNSYAGGVHQYCDSATLQDNAGTVNVGKGGWNLPVDRTHFRGAHTGIINLDNRHAAYAGVPGAFTVSYGGGVKETNTDFNTTRVETQLAVPTAKLGADKVGPFCD